MHECGLALVRHIRHPIYRQEAIMRQRTASLDLSAWTLKLTAMAAMLIDHVAWVFWPQFSWQGILSHTIGAMAMPIFLSLIHISPVCSFL